MQRTQPAGPGALTFAILALGLCAEVGAEELEATTGTPQQVLLEARFAPDSRHYVEVEDTSQETGAGDSVGQNIGVIGFFETVAEGPLGLLELEWSFDRRQFQSWDSDEAPRSTSTVARVFASTLGRNLVLELDEDRHADHLSGLEPMVDAIRAEAGDARSVEFLLTEFTAEEFQRNLFEVRRVFFPDRVVSVGEQWSASHRTAPLRGSVTMNYQCTLDGLEQREGRKLARVRYQASAEPESADDSVNIVAVNSLEANGAALLDVETGMLVELREEAEMKFDQSMVGEDRSMERQSYMKRTIRVLPAIERERRWTPR
jgi:hypothetical protein